jgi:hypothetical protein
MWHLTRASTPDSRDAAQSPVATLSSVGADRARPGIVHRLDRNTTGASRPVAMFLRPPVTVHAPVTSRLHPVAGSLGRAATSASFLLAAAVSACLCVVGGAGAMVGQGHSECLLDCVGQGPWWWPRRRAPTGPSTSSSPAGPAPSLPTGPVRRLRARGRRSARAGKSRRLRERRAAFPRRVRRGGPRGAAPWTDPPAQALAGVRCSRLHGPVSRIRAWRIRAPNVPGRERCWDDAGSGPATPRAGRRMWRWA